MKYESVMLYTNQAEIDLNCKAQFTYTGCFMICATIKNCNTNLAIYARVIGNTSNGRIYF